MWCEWWILGAGGRGGLSEGDNRLTNRHKRKGSKDEGGIRVALSGMNPLACLFSCELQARLQHVHVRAFGGIRCTCALL